MSPLVTRRFMVRSKGDCTSIYAKINGLISRLDGWR